MQKHATKAANTTTKLVVFFQKNIKGRQKTFFPLLLSV